MEEIKLDLNNLARYGVHNTVILCYDINDTQLNCWIRKKETNEITSTKIQIDKRGWTNFIYIYHKDSDKGNEYVLLFEDKKYEIKKIVGEKEEKYNAIKNIIDCSDVNLIIHSFLHSYERVGNDKMSIIDVALDEFNIDDCLFYEKIRVFMSAVHGERLVYDVHVLDGVSKNKDLKTQSNKLKEKLNRCICRK